MRRATAALGAWLIVFGAACGEGEDDPSQPMDGGVDSVVMDATVPGPLVDGAQWVPVGPEDAHPFGFEHPRAQPCSRALSDPTLPSDPGHAR